MSARFDPVVPARFHRLLDHALAVRSGLFPFELDQARLKEAVALARLSSPPGKASDPVRIVVFPDAVKLAVFQATFLETAFPAVSVSPHVPSEGISFVFDLAALTRIATAFRGTIPFAYHASPANLVVGAGRTRIEVAAMPELSFQDCHARLRNPRALLTMPAAVLRHALECAGLFTLKTPPDSPALSQISFRQTEAGQPLPQPMAVGSNPSGSQLSIYQSSRLAGFSLDLPFQAASTLGKLLSRVEGNVEIHLTDTFCLLCSGDLYFGFSKCLARMPNFGRFLSLKPTASLRLRRADLLDSIAKVSVAESASAGPEVLLRLSREGFLEVSLADAAGRTATDAVAAPVLSGDPSAASLSLGGLLRSLRAFRSPEVVLAFAPSALLVTETGDDFQATSVISATRAH